MKRTSNRRFGEARTRAGIHSEHAAAEKDEVRYPSAGTTYKRFNDLLTIAILVSVHLDARTRQAITHTWHCLTGCAIGEIFGLAIAQNWNNILQTFLGIVLAFFFGYLLTSTGAVRGGMQPKDALKLALAVDTISIISMVIIDNAVEWLIPGAINAHLSNAIFWWSEAISFSIAFILTVPVNRFVMSRGIGHSSHSNH